MEAEAQSHGSQTTEEDINHRYNLLHSFRIQINILVGYL